MLNTEHNFIFVHVPKTAGTSIESVFDSMPDSRGPGDFKKLVGWDPEERLWMQHLTMSEISEKYVSNSDSYYKFAFVRNPWDRVISDYFFFLAKTQNKGSLFQFLLESGPFERFKVRTKNQYRADHFRSQHEFIYNSSGDCLVDFVGRFENLQNDFDKVCERIGIPKVELPKLNTRKSKEHFTKYYDQNLIQMVSRKYKHDIELFGYSFNED